MPKDKKLNIVVVSAFYSEGMGYSENCLPRALAQLGHNVHVVTSIYNVYGTESLYDETYSSFLGPRQVATGSRPVDGYYVHRLETNLVGGYVNLRGLIGKIAELSPDIVHSLEIASLQTFTLAISKSLAKYKLFCETHQTLSVLKPYMKDTSGAWHKRAVYRLTRTLPTFLASLAVEKCYAITPDGAEVAREFYGVPASKIKLLSFGADTDMFRPNDTPADSAARNELRRTLGYENEDIVCVYTGRFTRDKNPLLLAQAIELLNQTDPRYKGLFIGDGVQKSEIAACRSTTILPFMTHKKLAEHYRATDLGVWPRQESMSMIDAAASGVPLVVSNKIGEPARVTGNGKMYEENDVSSLAEVLRSFASAEDRRSFGTIGRQKMLDGLNWSTFARTVEADFLESLAD